MGFIQCHNCADEPLIHTVMALYTEACTIVRTDAGLSESFEVKDGLHEGSVLSLLKPHQSDIIVNCAFHQKEGVIRKSRFCCTTCDTFLCLSTDSNCMVSYHM